MRRRVAPRRRRVGSLERYLGAGERTILVTRQHPFALVRAALDAAALLTPLLVAAWGIAGVEALHGSPGSWLLRLLFLVMAGIVGRLAWAVLAWEFERVVVTDEKVIHLNGVLARRIASTPLAKVSEFTVHQPVLGRVFDFGSLVVDVPGGRDQALHGLAFLPDPAGLYRLVSDQARRGRLEEGGGHDALVDADALRIAEQFPVREWDPSDPWTPAAAERLAGSDADHTISIPRVIPPR